MPKNPRKLELGPANVYITQLPRADAFVPAVTQAALTPAGQSANAQLTFTATKGFPGLAGNAIQVAYVVAAGTNPLTITVGGTAAAPVVNVNVATTNGTGISTPNDVIAAFGLAANAAAAAIVTPTIPSGTGSAALVAAAAANLTGGLVDPNTVVYVQSVRPGAGFDAGGNAVDYSGNAVTVQFQAGSVLGVVSTGTAVVVTVPPNTTIDQVISVIRNDPGTSFLITAARATQGLGSAQNPPATAATAAIGAAGAVNVGNHTWVYSFVTNGIESAFSPVSNILNVITAASIVNLSGVTVGPAGTTKRNIYRTVSGNTGAYLFVGSINDNVATTFADNIADSGLGAAFAAGLAPQTVAAVSLTGGAGAAIRRDVGFLGDEVAYQVTTEAANLTGAQTGNVPQDKVIIGGMVRVVIPFKEISLENLQAGVPSARIVSNSDGSKRRVEFDVAVGASMRQTLSAKMEIIKIKGGFESTLAVDKIVIPAISPAEGEVNFPFAPVTQRVVMTNWYAWPDPNTGRWAFFGDELP